MLLGNVESGVEVQIPVSGSGIGKVILSLPTVPI
jgi:hypothetical protein